MPRLTHRRSPQSPVLAHGVPSLLALAVLVCPVAQAAVTNCTVAASAVAFGTYTPLTTATSTGTLSISCTVTSHRNTITIDLSTGTSNSYTQRTMTSGANTLGYNLFIDAANTQVWGNGTNSTEDSVTLTRTHGATTVDVTETVYGTIPASQDPAPGSYTDAITVGVNY